MNCSCQFGDKGYQYKSLPDSVFDAVGGQIDYASESDDCMDNDEQIRSPNSEHDGVDKNQELSLEYNQWHVSIVRQLIQKQILLTFEQYENRYAGVGGRKRLKPNIENSHDKFVTLKISRDKRA